MALLPFRDYLAAAAEAAKDRGLASPLAVFLSTDDPGVLRDAKARARAAGWTLMYVPFERRVEMDLNARGDVVVLHALEGLLVHVGAAAWVGTRASNWDRLIDELRQTWAGAAEVEAPYVAVGKGAYSGEQFGWR